MTVEVAVLGAGGPAGVNVCRALHAAGHEVTGIDHNSLHLPWAAPYCARTICSADLSADLLNSLDAQVAHSQPEQPVLWLSEHRGELSAQVLLPRPEVIRLTQDKFGAASRWFEKGLREHPPVEIREPYPDHLHLAADQFTLPYWLRARKGAGAKGAILVRNVAQAYHWIRFWAESGGDLEWVAEQYLPGRDFCWTSLWREGRLIAAFARERLEWMYPHLTPTGRTGTPAIAVTVHDEQVSGQATEAVLAVDPTPDGLYAVDLVHDADDIPRPTEINAGRFPTTSPLYSELGTNIPDLYVRLAAGLDVEPVGDNCYPAGVMLARHIDCGHVWTRPAA
jgi:carbamoyl-phosphate synthase large subunit